MLHQTLRKVSDVAHDSHHAAAPVIQLERQAYYMSFNNLGLIHRHDEPNFRKSPAGWAGYTNPKLADPYETFPFCTPIRHVDQVRAGQWFAMGHFGYFKWPFHRKWIILHMFGQTGCATSFHWFYIRMNRNGWQQKNRGAVYGMDK